MDLDTFETAQELRTRIDDLGSAIKSIENKTNLNSAPPVNIQFCFDEDYEQLREAVLKYLRNKKNVLEKKFDTI